ncbi:MAG: hypothetical protein PUG64_03560 [Bacteroidales bacterium]|nr:hypothetical protein [Bacteroidales bacterium]MDY3912908.1 hypothetical protein [Sodaliphilus sp.]
MISTILTLAAMAVAACAAAGWRLGLRGQLSGITASSLALAACWLGGRVACGAAMAMVPDAGYVPQPLLEAAARATVAAMVWLTVRVAGFYAPALSIKGRMTGLERTAGMGLAAMQCTVASALLLTIAAAASPQARQAVAQQPAARIAANAAAALTGCHEAPLGTHLAEETQPATQAGQS